MAGIEITTSWGGIQEELTDIESQCQKAGVSLTVKSSDALTFEPTLIIAVLGGVSGYIIGRLIEAVLTRIVGPPGFITVRHRKKRFRFPQDREACLEHFRVPSPHSGVRGWVFVSHSSQDCEYIEDELFPLLCEQGNRPWYSDYEIKMAEEWERRVLVGLRSCEWFLVVLSKSAVASAWVRAEVHWAMERRQGKVIPVLIEDCCREDLHLGLLPIQYIDFRNDQETAQAELLRVLGEGPCR
jgi:hypothetical protein